MIWNKIIGKSTAARDNEWIGTTLSINQLAYFAIQNAAMVKINLNFRRTFAHLMRSAYWDLCHYEDPFADEDSAKEHKEIMRYDLYTRRRNSIAAVFLKNDIAETTV